MTPDAGLVARLFERARPRGAGALLESEGLALLEALGLDVPRHLELRDAAAVAALAAPPFAGERAVVKVVSTRIRHKTEAGGVAIVPNTVASIGAAARDMERRLPAADVDGFMISEYVPFSPALGHELLVGLRWTDDFGAVVTVGAGGVATEFLAGAFRDDSALAVLSPALARGDEIERALARVTAVRRVTEPLRGQPPPLEMSRLADVVRRFLWLAERFAPVPLAEFEVNPLVISGGRLVALDALATTGSARPAPAPARPLAKVRALLEPRTVAIVGVSEKGLNPGRIILQNLLRDGFDPARITVVKPGTAAIDGVRCVPALDALPERVDLLVLAIAAGQAPEAIAAAADGARAESIILIPGGLDERPESAPLVARMREALARARASAGRGPVVNGGNCLGVRSVPGRVNTLFIPEHKLPLPRGAASPMALVSGSGAFAVSKTSKLAGLNPRYVISVGNQMDLTLADYLEVLKDDDGVELFAVYAEGFQPLDGLRFLAAARAITDAGRTVVLYRGGRTQAGAAAAASHTAAVAGDYAVTRALAAAAGVVVADSLEDFEDLTRLFALLRGRRPAGTRLGAVSNAGFECVAIADSLGAFTLAEWTPETRAALVALLERARLADIVAVRDPIDLTPTLGDSGFAEVSRLVLEDPLVDVGLIGCVPMTGALDTLAPGSGHTDDIGREDSIAGRLVRLFHATTKPWVAVVDAGRLYDAMAQRLEDGGVPTFRTADRALRLFDRWCAARLRAPADEAGSGVMSPATRFVPGDHLGLEPLATLFNRGYEGYFVPIQLDAEAFAVYAAAWDLDLAATRVALAGGQPVAFALLGVRGRRGWVGGMGVVPELRGRGLGRAAMDAVMAEARARGLAAVGLEVLEQNTWAARIYEGMGFRDTRALEVWSRPADAPPLAAEPAPQVAPVPVDEALAAHAALHPQRPPWQREQRSLARQSDRLAALAVRRAGSIGALAIFHGSPQRVSLLALAARPDAPAGALPALLAALTAAHPGATVTLANLPAGDPAGAALAAAGFTVRLRQREMTRAL